MYRFGGRQHEMGLGSAAPHAVTLQEARNRAAGARRAAVVAAKAASITFGAFADEYVNIQKPGWRNESTPHSGK